MVFNQYINYHNEYRKKYGKETVIFMQVGSFFELYGIYQDDKIIGCDVIKISEILNVQYTKKDKKKPDNILSNPWMCGFPDHSITKFRNVLLNNNYTIVLVEQVTAAPNPEREVTEILSPGTIIDPFNKSTTNNLLSIYITQYTDYKSHKEIFVCGLSVIDIGTGECHVMETRSIPDDINLYIDEAYRFIHTYNPIEVIIHLSEDIKTLSENNKNNAFSQDNCASLKSHKFTKQWFVNVLEIITPNVYINNIVGDQYSKVAYQNQFLLKVYQECGMLTPIEYIDMECMPDALISFLYLLQFAYEHKDNIIQNIRKPEISNVYNHLILSNNAIQQLNVYDNFNNYSGRYNSLYNILCKCKTPIGRRLLKNRLLSPIIDPVELNNRYDLIEFFLKKSEDDYLYSKYQAILQKIQDID
jgi:DNA mismatch repair protein MutS